MPGLWVLHELMSLLFFRNDELVVDLLKAWGGGAAEFLSSIFICSSKLFLQPSIQSSLKKSGELQKS